MECRELPGGVVIVENLAAVVAQQVIGSHSCFVLFFQTNVEILAYSFSRIITTKFLWLAWLAIQGKSLKEAVLRVLLQVMTK